MFMMNLTPYEIIFYYLGAIMTVAGFGCFFSGIEDFKKQAEAKAVRFDFIFSGVFLTFAVLLFFVFPKLPVS